MALIAPSLLSADFGNLARDVRMIDQSAAAWHHIDIMDGVFVPNLSFGLPVVKAIAKEATKPLDVHLMIVDPDRYIHAFRDAGATHLTVHWEACTHLHRTIQAIKAAGMRPGIALNPHTPVASIEDILGDVDLVCLMSVNPGFGGQSFIENTLLKIVKLRQMAGSSLQIEIDGGVTLTNAPVLLKAGADVLVAGNTVFGSADPAGTIATLSAL